MKYLTLIVIYMYFLVGCSGESSIKLESSPDTYSSHWNDSLVLDVLSNDTYSGEVSIEIVDEPLYGIIQIDNHKVVYYPHSKKKVSDSFSYKISSRSGVSNTSNVQIKIGNFVESVEFIDLLSGQRVSNIQEFESYKVKMALSVSSDEDSYFHVIEEVENKSNLLVEQTLPSGERILEFDFTPSGKGEKKLRLIEQGGASDAVSYEIPFNYMATSDPENMFLSIKGIWFNKPSADLFLKKRGFVLSWMNYPVWEIPEKPTWSEDPYKNNSWQLYYHSLFWLFAYEYAYIEYSNEEYLDIIGDTILDYLAKSPKDNPKSYMSWDDHSVSWRTDVIAYFYNKYFNSRWSQEDKRKFKAGLTSHANELRELLDNPLFEKNNHGMFHALSLYNLTFSYPAISIDTDYKQRSQERIFELLENMVDVETGVSLEQSTHYQLVALDLFLTANELMYNLEGAENPELSSKLEKMIDFSAHIIYPNGGGPAIGDSNYGHTNYLNVLNKYIENKGLESQYLDYLNSKGIEGRKPERLFYSEKAGYAIFHQISDSEFDRQSILFSDFGKKKYAHGHHDAMSFTYFDDGEELLIDSGGPYVYLPPGRTYFWSKYGHNSLVINGEGSVLEDAKLIDTKCEKSFCYVMGQLVQHSILHTRAIIMVGEQSPSVYVIDYVSSEQLSDYELLYHFPISSEVHLNSTITNIKLKNGKEYFMDVQSNLEMDVDIYKGIENNNVVQGWVTPKYAKKLPSPVISYKGSGSKESWLVTSVTKSSLENRVNVSVTEGVIHLKTGSFEIMLNMSDIKEPKITY